MLKLKNKEIDVEEFALEYIKHDALLRRYPHRGNKYKRVVAYGALGRRFGVGALQARAFERLFRRYVNDKMESLVCDGLRDIDELPEELSWLALVEEKFKLLPKLLATLGVGARPAVSPDALVAALCTQARLRGALCDSAVCAAVRRALRLAASDNDLQAAWESAKRLSLEYLTASARAGDAGEAAPHAGLAHVADVVLLYSADTTLLTDESEQLYPEAQALSALWLLVQRHRLEERAPPRSRVRAQRWTRAHRDYLATGRAASLVVLQRRWHELKLRSRYKLLNYWRTTTRGRPGRSATPSCSDPPREIHISVLKRYPHIVTSPLPSWKELVDRGLIVTRPLDDVINVDTEDCVPAVTESRKRPADDGLYPAADTDCSPVKNRCIKTEPDGLNIKYTYPSNVPCVVKAEEDVKNVDNFNLMLQNIKKEVDDETENNSYDDTQTVDRVDSAVKVEVFSKEVELDMENNPNDDAHRVNDSVVKIEVCATDDIVPSYEVTVEFPVKDEPVSTMSSRITFLEDDTQGGNGNGDEEDDSDDDDVEDDLDDKLLLAPRVRLSRVDAVLSPPTPSPPLEELHHELHIKSEIEHTDAVGQTRIMFDDHESELDAHIFAVDMEEAESGLWRQHFQFRKRAARVSKAQQSLAVTLPHNNKLYILKRVEPAAEFPEPDKNPVISIEAQTLSSRQLTFLLHELTDVAMANHLLKRTQRPCCAARKHKDVSDARERMGLPPLPKHTHADGSPCACCCAGRVWRRPRHELDAERRALRRDLAAMLQDTRL